MSENKYVELTQQLVDKAEELQAMQLEMHELAQAKDQEASTVEVLKVSEDISDQVQVSLDIDFNSSAKEVIVLSDKEDDHVVVLSIEDFNNINQFLGRYNEVIYRFHNHLEAQKAEADND